MSTMKKYVVVILAVFMFVSVSLLIPGHPINAAAEIKLLIYDQAELLTQDEHDELNQMANEYGAKRETDIIILTTNNAENVDIVDITENFYDEIGLGYDQAFGNAVILTLDMKNRDVYLAGFYKAEEYLDDGRLDKIREKITSDLSSGNYKSAFKKYIKTSYKYMGFKPGVNPDNILFNIWFQLGVAIAIGWIIVGVMAYRSGGRITVNRKTYEDGGSSGIVDRQDRYIRTTVTKTQIPKNNGGGSGGGGGGGGVTRGGHSHSGSRGKF